MNIYEKCPEFESERFLIRQLYDKDCDDLLKVYSDKKALPFFNSDNCDGDNFYYATKEKMAEAISFFPILASGSVLFNKASDFIFSIYDFSNALFS